MHRIRRSIVLLFVLGALTCPLKGCAGGPAGGGGITQLLMGTAASVGTYFLIKELD